MSNEIPKVMQDEFTGSAGCFVVGADGKRVRDSEAVITAVEAAAAAADEAVPEVPAAAAPPIEAPAPSRRNKQSQE